MPATSPSRSFSHLLASSSVWALVVAGALTMPSMAADILVSNGTTVAQQTLNPGDVLTVEAGGQVADANEAILDTPVAGAITINNQGSINSTTDTAVYIANDTLTINNGNNALIQGNGTGIYAVKAKSINNSGTIIGEVLFGVFALQADSIINSGTISGSDYGLEVNQGGSVVNSGLISGALTAGLAAANLTTLQNTSTGRIISGLDALTLQNQGSLDNAGIIEGDRNGIASVLGHIGTINNSALINGKSGAGISMGLVDIDALSNSGSITGGKFGIYGSNIWIIDNSGLIGGGNSAGQIGLKAGNITKLTNAATGVITGAAGITASNIDALNNSGKITGTIDNGVLAQSIAALTNTATGHISGLTDGVATAIGGIGTINNAGSVQGGNNGIYSKTDIAALTNSGDILGGLNGAYAEGLFSSLTNSGTITGTGQYGVYGDVVANISNDGTILGGSSAIHAANAVGNIVNASKGRIDGTSMGIEADNIGAITNAGTITGGTRGIFADGGIVSITNSGTISGFGSIADEGAIITNGVLGSLTNSGTIRAADPTKVAIFEGVGGGATELNLNAGSIIIGHVDIHNGADTLNVGPGLNLALTFDTSIPELINTGKNPYVVLGNTVYVADISNFAAAQVMTADLTGTLSDTLGAVLNQDADEKGVDGAGNYWLQGLGGLGAQANANGGPTISSRFGGFAAGADFGADVETRFGALVGAARAAQDGSAGTVDSAYAGIYGASQLDDVAVRGQIVAGYGRLTDWSRIVANNTVATGLETLTGTGDGYFISPGVTLTKPWVTQDLSFETLLSLNYTAVFSNGMTENSPVGVTASSGTTHIVDAKALIRLPTLKNTEDGVVTADVHTGVAGRVVVSPDLTGTLAGTPVSFTQGGTTTSLGLVVGWAAALKLDGGASLSTNLDATFRSDSTAALSGNVGFKANF